MGPCKSSSIKKKKEKEISYPPPRNNPKDNQNSKDIEPLFSTLPQFYCNKCNILLTNLTVEINKGHGDNLIPIPDTLRQLYTFEKALGKGGCGVVFHAIEKSSGTSFALKMMLIRDVDDDMTPEENMQYLLKKNKITASLQHKNIIKQFQSMILPEQSLMVVKMELAEKSLNTLIKEGISTSKVYEYIIQICEGLQYLHEEIHVIHRDLKPENILLIGNCIKICDFDTVKAQKTKSGKTTISLIVGTNNYKAPETILGTERIDEKVDIWALGIIFHKMFTGGVHPFDVDKESDNRLKTMLDGKYQIHNSIKDENIIRILKACFEINSEKRPSVNKILNQLQHPSVQLDFEEKDETEKTITKIKKEDFKIQNQKNPFYEIDTFKSEEFEILNIIEKGGFHRVYRCHNKILGIDCAITMHDFKVEFDEGYVANQTQIKLMLIKANLILMRMNHSAFLTYKFYRDGKKFISIQEMGLGAMNDVLKIRKKAYSEKEIAYILGYLIDGCAIAQENGFAHRDIKPGNILFLQLKNGVPSYKFIDFEKGIIMNENQSIVSCSSIKGLTRSHAAPEILEILDDELDDDASLYNPFKADVFSMGIVILEMMGCLITTIKTLRNQNFEKFNPYMELDYPKLLPVVRKMLEINPEERLEFKEISKLLSEIPKSPPDENEIDVMKILKEKRKKQTEEYEKSKNKQSEEKIL